MSTPPKSTPVPATLRLVTAAELADHLSVTRATIYNLMSRGMPSVKVGRARRFRLPEVDRWLDEQG